MVSPAIGLGGKFLLVALTATVVAYPGTKTPGFGPYFFLAAGLLSVFGMAWAVTSTVRAMMIERETAESGTD